MKKTKICTKCKNPQPLANFYKELHGKNGRKSMCKRCTFLFSICPHQNRKSACKKCCGGSLCTHLRIRRACKQCGTHSLFLKNGFTSEEVKQMGAVTICQFPGCRIESRKRALYSDHFHDGNKVNPENYRGEICSGHNVMLRDLDEHPEWANAQEKKYMIGRPYSRGAKQC